MTAKVTVVGSFVVGLTLRTERIPVAGETTMGTDFDLGPGGKGSNQAVQAARLGADVEMVGLVGDDDFASIPEELYASEGVGTTYFTRTSGSNTAVGFIILDAEGQNRIIIDSGANALLTPEVVARARPRIEESDVVYAQLESAVAGSEAGLKMARSSGAIALLNPAPARPVPPDLLASVDVLTPNALEARMLLGMDPEDPTDDLDVCKQLIDRGVRTLVMTQGERGALIVTAEGASRVDAFPVDVVDTTGAGDAFSGTLGVYLAEGRSIEDAARYAAAAGALACTKLGVIPALADRASVEKLAG
jgi:ribokinase